MSSYFSRRVLRVSCLAAGVAGVAGLAACGGAAEEATEVTEVTAEDAIMGGTADWYASYWNAVEIRGCSAVALDEEWVLTARHRTPGLVPDAVGADGGRRGRRPRGGVVVGGRREVGRREHRGHPCGLGGRGADCGASSCGLILLSASERRGGSRAARGSVSTRPPARQGPPGSRRRALALAPATSPARSEAAR